MLSQMKLLAVCLLWLTMVQGRPGSHARHTAVLSLQRAAEGREERQGEGDRRAVEIQGKNKPARGTGPDTQGHSDRTWTRFFSDFMNKQKTFRGRTRKGSSSSCFGAKMDRIGAMSSLGC
ncbi:C-type natriuretic peptide 3 [Stegostoma tigrinum]|uniref:C-type natriuretic peptide 3 n=1 Tax=Stegostoma tigrinum TaxID=3053191 RepID=UPI002870458A|nr:C-type natriuretic peptide 3 [Stegostoma tigrinum]